RTEGRDDVTRRHGDALRHAVDEVATTYLDGAVIVGVDELGGAHGALDLLGGAITDEEVVAVLDEGHDVAVEGVARDAEALRHHDATQAEDGEVGGTAADVDDHRPDRFGDLDACPDGPSDWLLDEVRLAGADLVGRLHHGALLHLADAAGYAHHDVGTQEPRGSGQHLADEGLEHLLGQGVVGDDTVGHGPDGSDVARCP